jgi:hypothetical protein
MGGGGEDAEADPEGEQQADEDQSPSHFLLRRSSPFD